MQTIFYEETIPRTMITYAQKIKELKLYFDHKV